MTTLADSLERFDRRGFTAHFGVAGAGLLVLHLLSGSVRLRTGGRTETVGRGKLVVLEAAIEHAVEAVDESARRLTLVGPFRQGDRPTP